MNGQTNKTFSFVSLGCPKNLVDSERMLGKLAQGGYSPVNDAVGSDVVVINTCAFIESSRQESLGVIREMIELKKAGKIGSVVVAGCLAERHKELLLEQVPEIDQIVGVFAREEIVSAVDRAVSQSSEQRSVFAPVPVRALEDTARLRVTPRHYAYIKISEGCDRLCTFCAIPKMRGKHVTKAIEEVLKEAEELARDGVRELIIVAQDSTYYGMDLYGRPRLAELLRKLCKIQGIEWIRLLYAYPEHVSDELLDTLASEPKILPYIDMPLQHISDRMLKRMQRRVTRSSTESLLTRLRQKIPNMAIRTTFIVGFPGETDADIAELNDFLQSMKFERAGVFTYSLEADTPASRMDGHLPEEVKRARHDSVMETQQGVALNWSLAQVGRETEAIIDGPDPEFPGHWQGRTWADSPDIDCIIRVKGKNLASGDIVRVKVAAADDYDLAGRAIGVAR